VSSILVLVDYYQQLPCPDSCFVITGRSTVQVSLPKTRGPPTCLTWK
jgi:hypothetical protein